LKPFSLYIHIPFCFQKCPYCDFNTYAVRNVPEKEYIGALLSELDYYAHHELFNKRSIQTIYFGGGTPSLLAPASIAQIIKGANALFDLPDGAEITMEANPTGLSIESLEGFAAAGVNRISFGAQSFRSDQLELLGRNHRAEDISNSIEYARAAGLDNLSIDLIYGVPGQSRADLISDIDNFLNLNLPHLSLYALTIEKGTPFYQARANKVFSLPDDEIVLGMMDDIEERLSNAHYSRYEISNYCRLGSESRHNLAYWNRDDYLGIGAGAHSFCRTLSGLQAKRWSNYALPVRYMDEATAHGGAISWQEDLGAQDLQYEFFFLGLRKTTGVEMDRFEEEFQPLTETRYMPVIERGVDNGLLEISGKNLKLTHRGITLADSVLEEFAL